ncbi:MAG: hypothetical protein CMK92_05675 [Pseudomonas sp.]|nr:hypothetical protein [Pseudomonas sp.]|tara:strand:- start:73 stop:648 length:576 start_codon:yes stop_codon:yes gene_type:complete
MDYDKFKDEPDNRLAMLEKAFESKQEINVPEVFSICSENYCFQSMFVYLHDKKRFWDPINFVYTHFPHELVRETVENPCCCDVDEEYYTCGCVVKNLTKIYWDEYMNCGLHFEVIELKNAFKKATNGEIKGDEIYVLESRIDLCESLLILCKSKLEDENRSKNVSFKYNVQCLIYNVEQHISEYKVKLAKN